MFDLIDIHTSKKMRIKKIILIIIISLAILVGSAFAAIFTVRNMNRNKIIEENLISIKRTKHEVIINYDYNLSEQAKQNIKEIYVYDGKRVFLTFDDGPSKTVTPLILDFLKQEEIQATFFLLGSRVEFYPSIVKRIYEEGHFIANHGYSHIYKQIYTSPEAVLEEYYKTEELIRKALDKPEYKSNIFRFPGGTVGGKYKDIKNNTIQLLEQNNIAYLDWNALTGDSEGRKTKEELLEYAKATIGDKNSVVMLMHDAGDKILTYEILPELILYLREKGYEFNSLYDILKTNIQ